MLRQNPWETTITESVNLLALKSSPYIDVGSPGVSPYHRGA